MRSLPLRSLLSRLTAFALTAGAAAPAYAVPAPSPCRIDCGLDDDTPIDPENLAPSEAGSLLGRSLALALIEARPIAATQLAATWATSDDTTRRLAVAHSLEWSFPLVGAALVIDHLSRDADATIRAAAARAAWARRSSGGDDGVLARLVDDPDPAVRAIATSAH